MVSKEQLCAAAANRSRRSWSGVTIATATTAIVRRFSPRCRDRSSCVSRFVGKGKDEDKLGCCETAAAFEQEQAIQ